MDHLNSPLKYTSEVSTISSKNNSELVSDGDNIAKDTNKYFASVQLPIESQHFASLQISHNMRSYKGMLFLYMCVCDTNEIYFKLQSFQ